MKFRNIATVFFASIAVFCVSCTSVKVPEKSVEICAVLCPNAPKDAIKADYFFVIAMHSESKYIVANYGLEEICENFHAGKGIACITTGVGGKEVNNALSGVKLGKGVRVINVGYCGSNTIPKGKVVEVSQVAKIEAPQDIKKISPRGVPCYSSDVFVEETTIKEPCVFDMELSYIKNAYPDLISYKIVSDNLSHTEYEKFEADDAWREFFELVRPLIKTQN